MENHFTADQQSQGVKQSVDGVPWLVDGHDYGSSLTRHPVNMNQESSKYSILFYCSRCYRVYNGKTFLNLCNLYEFLLKLTLLRLFSIGKNGHPLKILDPFKLEFDKISCRDVYFCTFSAITRQSWRCWRPAPRLVHPERAPRDQ